MCADSRVNHTIHDANRVAIIGGTFSGNKGAAAMLESAIANLRHRSPRPLVFDVITVYPKRDRQIELPEDVRIVPAP
ncbi:MAG: hypothetical protein JSU64_03695, partial [candidate division WOR-3 bacterium]